MLDTRELGVEFTDGHAESLTANVAEQNALIWGNPHNTGPIV
jgi:hypothetical protein